MIFSRLPIFTRSVSCFAADSPCLHLLFCQSTALPALHSHFANHHSHKTNARSLTAAAATTTMVRRRTRSPWRPRTPPGSRRCRGRSRGVAGRRRRRGSEEVVVVVAGRLLSVLTLLWLLGLSKTQRTKQLLDCRRYGARRAFRQSTCPPQTQESCSVNVCTVAFERHTSPWTREKAFRPLQIIPSLCRCQADDTGLSSPSGTV